MSDPQAVRRVRLTFRDSVTTGTPLVARLASEEGILCTVISASTQKLSEEVYGSMLLGIPSGQQHELCRGLHAEQNALIQASRHGGIAGDGATLYCTAHPCVQCTKMLINAGVKRIVYRDSYPDELSSVLLAEAGIATERFGG